MIDSTRDAVDALDPIVVAGLRELGGDEFIAELAAIFLDDFPQHIVNLKAAAKARDPLTIVSIAHALKSSCAQIGARPLSRLFVAIEDSGRAEAHPGVASLLDRIDSEWERVRRALEMAVARQSSQEQRDDARIR